MRSRRISFTRAPQKSIAAGKQFFWLGIDLGGDLRVLDLQLSVYALTGGVSPEITIAVLTSAQDDLESGWATLGTFPKVNDLLGPDSTVQQVMSGALRYVRFEVVALTSGTTCYFMIEGEARTHE